MGRPLPAPSWDLPDPAEVAEPGIDLVAVGAELEPATIVSAYRLGLFPMNVGEGGPLGWWSPDPRGVLPLDDLRVTRSLAKSARRHRVTFDTAFGDVIRECGDRRRDDGWITADFVDAYSALHELGWAHSVEVWDDDALVGGLYGIEIGGLFAGESMFHRSRDASKVGLVALVERLRAAGGDRLLDTQWRTDHLATLGVVAIPRDDYLQRLAAVLETPPAFPI